MSNKYVWFMVAYFTMGAIYYYVFGRIYNAAIETLEQHDFLEVEIKVFKIIGVLAWPLFVCLDMMFPEKPDVENI
jgi:hypothetical protein